MSNSGLECVGSCLQCCSEYQRGEARRGTAPLLPCPAGRLRSCAGTDPARHRDPRPPALTPNTIPLHGDGSRDLALAAALPTSAHSPSPSVLPVRCRQEPGSFQMGEGMSYSILKPAGRTERTPALLLGLKGLLEGSNPPWGAPAQPGASSPLRSSYRLRPRAAARRCSTEIFSVKPQPWGVKPVFCFWPWVSTLMSDLQSCLCRVSRSQSGSDV